MLAEVNRAIAHAHLQQAQYLLVRLRVAVHQPYQQVEGQGPQGIARHHLPGWTFCEGARGEPTPRGITRNATQSCR